jgi:predicted RNA polymerase sigma factor
VRTRLDLRDAARPRTGGAIILGATLPLTQQDRSRWGQLSIGRGLDALARAEALGGDGPYVLQAARAACHASARQAADTDWPRMPRSMIGCASRCLARGRSLHRAIAHKWRSGLKPASS